MRNQLRKFILFVCGMGLTACAGPQLMQPQSLKTSLRVRQSYLAFQVTFDSAIPLSDPEGCRLVFYPATGDHQFAVPVKLGTQFVILPVKSGNYSVREFSCDYNHSWVGFELTQAPITVFPEKVSAVGSLAIALKGTPGNGNLSIQFEDPEKTRGRLQEAFREGGSDFRARVVTADLGKPVTVEILGVPVNPPHLEYHFEKGARKPVDFAKGGGVVIDSCTLLESKRPIRLGSLQITAHYQQGKPAQIQVEKDLNTLSPEYRECIEGALKGFRWDGPGQVEIQFRL